ncbi:agmatinase family protein [Phenylobacterium sp. LjRoot219]|uniref:agmatinase family protein n=1 Tax=Phenylobacterium sp. LjRoot219 TaxID=3342283 RepID=UPI003ECC7FCB
MRKRSLAHALLVTTAAGLALLVAQSASGQGAPARAGPAASPSDLEPVEIPADLQAKLSVLPKEKLDFIRSGKGSRYVRPERLFEKLRTINGPQLVAYVDAIISVAEAGEFKAGRDKATIPLNKNSPTFNAWKVKRPQTMNPKREPGPIELGKYVGGFGGGIPTFANAPVAMTPEDLVAGKVDVAIVGAPLDMGSGWRDALHGPVMIRAAGGANGNDMYSMVNPSQELKIVDYGDVAVDNLSTERSMQHVRETVREIAKTGAIPIVIGGDHSLEYPNLAGITDVLGKGNVGVVHFDSHYDAGRDRVHLIDHGQPVYRVINEGHVPGKNYVQVGLRARSPDTKTFQWMRDQGMRYHTMVDVERRGWEAVMNDAVAEAKQSGKKLWISFDIDVLDPAFMPGTGTPVPGGLTMREAQPIVRRLCAENDLAGMDIVEYAPYLDPSYKTALNSNFLLNACLSGIAMRKKGLTQEHYLSPMSSMDRPAAAAAAPGPKPAAKAAPAAKGTRR